MDVSFSLAQVVSHTGNGMPTFHCPVKRKLQLFKRYFSYLLVPFIQRLIPLGINLEAIGFSPHTTSRHSWHCWCCWHLSRLWLLQALGSVHPHQLKTMSSSSSVHSVKLQWEYFHKLDLFIDRVIDHFLWWNNFVLEAGIFRNSSWTCSSQFFLNLFIYIDFQSPVATEAPKRETNIATIAPLLFSVRRHRRPARSGRKRPQWMYQRRGVMGFEGILPRGSMLLCKNLSNIEDFWLKQYWTFSFEGLCRIFGDW